MKVTDIGFGRFEKDFHADPNTMFVKPDRTKDTRTPYEQYEAGEKIIYVDLSDINRNWKPELMTRGEYFSRYLIHPATQKYTYSTRNIKIDFQETLNEE